jgi:protein-S-isoprenylcysteine O-methyltransferase Ste14
LLADRSAAFAVGAAFFAVGAGVAVAAVREFRSADTTVLPFGGTARVVTSGVYRWTRNPMYLGMALAYVGGSFVVNSGWCLVLLPVAVVLVQLLAIRPEERYLTGKFGESYKRYRSQVPRWM